MFIFYLPSGGEAGRVERYTKDDGVERVMELSDDGKQGYMILDVKRGEKPTTDLPARLWGSIMLSSPNKRNYKAWHETNTGTRLLYISRYHAREMKACFAWLRRADLAAGEGNAAVRTELEKLWRVMEERMREVGHAPRFVFYERSYRSRKDEVEWTLNKLIAGKVSYFLRVFVGRIEWRDDGTTHGLVDPVYLKGSIDEDCGKTPVSVAVRKGMLEQLREIVASDPRYSTPSITQ
ncbi:putative retrotransposon hot spot protein 4 (RHS4) [Trypanosoma vivax]|nr:putative retrotransposon hot spot protein 4 (RHS4) [Trypanosoma vivax]